MDHRSARSSTTGVRWGAFGALWCSGAAATYAFGGLDVRAGVFAALALALWVMTGIGAWRSAATGVLYRRGGPVPGAVAPVPPRRSSTVTVVRPMAHAVER